MLFEWINIIGHNNMLFNDAFVPFSSHHCFCAPLLKHKWLLSPFFIYIEYYNHFPDQQHQPQPQCQPQSQLMHDFLIFIRSY